MSGRIHLGEPGPRRRSLLARRNTTCPVCNEKISEGDDIAMIDGEAIHVKCED